ncbi:hypothetical protein E2C01_093577 [Portunus trituberculatus]|uniref:Uncharacterized protein n=1 Tax=Portunus trituberculatus TaxID=210409 RepID=A0A5B7JTX0_PORTR|nr:hypothetical protein [Portunus trituberculatus]
MHPQRHTTGTLTSASSISRHAAIRRGSDSLPAGEERQAPPHPPRPAPPRPSTRGRYVLRHRHWPE